MKNALYIFVLVLSISTVIFGHIHWKSKLASQVEAAKSELNSSNTTGNNSENTTTDKKETQSTSEGNNSVDELISNLPNALQEKMIVSKENNEALKVAIIGSGSINTDSGWTGQFTDGLNQAYGKEFFDIAATGFGKSISTSIHSSEKFIEIAKSQPDLVLLEPFILNDNIGVNIDDSLESIRIMERRLKEKNPNVTIFLQPPHPLFQPNHYKTQVDSVKLFAEETDMVYLDHWDNWPDVQNEVINDYVEGKSGPNEQGHELWAEYLVDYFTGK
jgi:hypothetical protein